VVIRLLDLLCQVAYYEYMTLNDFRLAKDWSFAELARQTGAAHATVTRRWCLPPGDEDRKIPSAKFMQAIVRITDGEVQPNDFYLLTDDDRG